MRLAGRFRPYKKKSLKKSLKGKITLQRPADCVPARRSADVPPPDPVDLPEPAGETAPVGLTLASW